MSKPNSIVTHCLTHIALNLHYIHTLSHTYNTELTPHTESSSTHYTQVGDVQMQMQTSRLHIQQSSEQSPMQLREAKAS